jgi:pSer/pThr/pTyr-binding forkhead associated (FHA) protein
MSEKLVKTDTIKYEDEDSWGKLTPLSAGLPTFSLKDDLILIGRNPACSIQINDKRLSGKHCQIKK